MVQTHRPVMTHRRLLLFKWLMVFIPPVTVAVGHSLLAVKVAVGYSPLGHTVGTLAETLLVTLPLTFLALVLAYLFAETLFRVLRRLQAEALAQEQDILTMNANRQDSRCERESFRCRESPRCLLQTRAHPAESSGLPSRFQQSTISLR